MGGGAGRSTRRQVKENLVAMQIFIDHIMKSRHFDPPRNRTRHLRPADDPVSHYAIPTRSEYMPHRQNKRGHHAVQCISTLPGVRTTAYGMRDPPRTIHLQG